VTSQLHAPATFLTRRQRDP